MICISYKWILSKAEWKTYHLLRLYTSDIHTIHRMWNRADANINDNESCKPLFQCDTIQTWIQQQWKIGIHQFWKTNSASDWTSTCLQLSRRHPRNLTEKNSLVWCLTSLKHYNGLSNNASTRQSRSYSIAQNLRKAQIYHFQAMIGQHLL